MAGVMIWVCTPYARDDTRDLGTAYNDYMTRFPDADWVCFLDHDVTQTHKQWYHLLEWSVAHTKPEDGAFVATVSRLNPAKSSWQMAGEALRQEPDIRAHWEEGARRHKEFGAFRVDVTDIEAQGFKPLSGAAFCVRVQAWRAMGGAPEGFLQVDWAIHRQLKAAGYRIYHLPGWYVFHWFNWA